MDIDFLVEDVIAREGGYTAHPADKGGPTRWGITQAVARAHGYCGDMRQFPRDEAKTIYRHIYWEQPGFAAVAEIAPDIAAELFDTGVNMGPQVPVGFLQRALNAFNREQRDYADIVVDRQIGPKTMSALNAFLRLRTPGGETVLMKAMETLQGERYLSLAERRPANEAFLYGWMANRIG
ncbi:MAG TPA: glycosyl hydrolase 108 family protein [Rhizorhapis sp.]